MINLSEYIGPITNATISQNIGFDTLNTESAFIKREYILTLSDGVKIPLANPEYLQFKNSTKGRQQLIDSNLDRKLNDAILLVWGETTTVEDLPDVEE